MSLLLASSCLQGQPLLSAARALLALGPDGLQLCPGHPPQVGLQPILSRVDCALRWHHGFSWTAYRQPVWTADGRPLLDEPERSLHPPEACARPFDAWLEDMTAQGRVIELMPPGSWLGCGAQLERAMAAGLRLAVDVSHLFIQRAQGAITEGTLRRIFDYAGVAEVHVSQNDGRYDLHAPVTRGSYGLGWAKERLAEGLPVVVESYLHKVPPEARGEVLECLR